MQPPLRIERMKIDQDTREALDTVGLPADVAEAWARFTAPLARTVFAAWAGDELLGAAITVSRPLAGYLRVGGLWLAESDDADEVVRLLGRAAEEFAWESGFVVVKREPDLGPAADEGSDADGGQATIPAPEFAGPIPDPAPPVPLARFTWRHGASPSAVPYMRQTTDFTCGPAALSMLLAARGILGALTRETELALWRQATAIGPCDPYGLAVTADGQGLRPQIVINTADTLFLEGLATPQERELKEFIQDGFKRQAGDAGIDVRRHAFEIEELAELIRAGGAAIVLVDELLVHDDQCPHWILVHGMEDGCFIAHDPWTEVSQGESWLDGYDVPLAPEALDRIAWTGNPPVRAMLTFAPPA
ncbi:peptidase C39 family protein [Actinospica durhamensis]|uniref:Peptidase C39 family protein n=1 Tax=Actinospica durhamensis TaxID=1508375 RepID=A0A941ITF3_9ACTN|nr:peptidase C39 family protein [Actinospica durhamensis]MBR7834296.1 peptidase C39 family protein [Actinospica durhamensis]